MNRRAALFLSCLLLAGTVAVALAGGLLLQSALTPASPGNPVPAAVTATPAPAPSTSIPATWQVPPGTKTAQTHPPASPQPYDASQLDPRVTQATVGSTIGISGYTKTVRPPSSVTNRIKLRLMREHGYTGDPAQWELDHFIPLGVGGSSNLSNLWLEPIGAARLKDKDENRAHSMVTSGAWTLAQGQQYIRDHWTIHY